MLDDAWETGLPTTITVLVEGSGASLFGRNWLEEIQLNWAEIAKINGITSKTSKQDTTPKGLPIKKLQPKNDRTERRLFFVIKVSN